MAKLPDEIKADEPGNEADAGRRRFLQGAGVAAGVLGAVAMSPALAQAAPQAQDQPKLASASRAELRRDVMASIQDDVKQDLAARAKEPQELPKPAGIKDGGMLDARFPVYYRISVPQAMRLVTEYFAAVADNDMAAVASTLHFPYATYEGIEPIIYKTQQEFISNPPPSIHMHAGKESQRRPGTYDIMDVLQFQTYNPVNVGIELCYTRYRADGYKIGLNQGIYSITNNDGKWGIQLSSIIFTPAEYIGQTFNDAIEAHLRQGRTGMAAFGEHFYDLLGRGAVDSASRDAQLERERQATRRTTASITGSPGPRAYFLSGWAGTPMEPYNSKGRVSRLQVSGPGDNSAINALSAQGDPMNKLDAGIASTNVEMPDGKPGWFFQMVGGGVGHYAYTNALNDARVIHAGPEKAHTIGGYIRYTPDNLFISETRSLGVSIYDLRKGTWGGGGGLGGSMRRDRTNDEQL